MPNQQVNRVDADDGDESSVNNPDGGLIISSVEDDSSVENAYA